ncbi:type II toxin-antitoxin system death-on-curing family toxin [bacterium]|nr:type II toxin-antitoxin system death-on-curing family toxin [bacterium]MCI0605633.1 type II toxin-antitoxin system death-on-curing family toxin [bacterium]
MKYLFPKQILFLHDRIIRLSGGLGGLRDQNLLESAVYRPQSTFGGQDLYADLFIKIAVLGHSLIMNHPFVDGNKRTGFESMRLMLRLNHYDLHAGWKTKYDFVLKVANKKITEDQMAEWIRKKSKPYAR